MSRTLQWILGGAALVATVGAVLLGAAEYQGRRLYREDMARKVTCVDSSDIRLRDGRLLGYLMRGSPKGTPVLYFHGALGSRLEFPAHPEVLDQTGTWLIAPDRPGCGCSTPQPGRNLLDWPGDVRQLVDSLGIGKFRIVAWSAGTPYALAVGLRMPERVTRIDLIGAVVPESYPEGKDKRDQDFSDAAALARVAPGLAYFALRHTVIRRESEPDWFEDRLRRGLSAVDREVTAQESILWVAKRSHATGQSLVAVGVTGDLAALGGEWGFAPAQVNVPVTMWQGTEDTLTPAERNQRLTRELPQVKRKMFPGEGHFLIYRREREILENR